jgi:anaerobic selenocysteine-containing dehydrogenase
MNPVDATARLLTACPLDCPDTCSLEVMVEDGRLVAIDAGPGNPLTQDFICAKVKQHARRVYAPERVMTPLVRVGAKGSGEFRPASWDEALDLVASRIAAAMAEEGPSSVVPYLYNSSAGLLAAEGLTSRLFNELGAARVLHTICAATAGAAWQSTFGSMLSADPHDVVHSRLVIVWGANPAISNIHFPPLVQKARAAGARLVVVDPRRTAMARRADRHLALRPGTDVALVLGIVRHLAENDLIDKAFVDGHATGADEVIAAAASWGLARTADVTGVPAADIASFAEELASIRPAFIRIGWGLERNRNGGSSFRSVLALPVLTGQLGVLGAGIMSSLSGAGDFSLGNPSQGRRKVNMNQLGTELPAMRVLFVQGSNPAVTAPRQQLVLEGLARDDLFTVVHEQVLTDTALYADVVLPATTHFEADDLAGSYGSFTLQRVAAVIDRVGESRTNDEVGAGLAARLGLDMQRFGSDPEALMTEGLDGAAPPRAGDVEVLRKPGTAVQFRDTFPDFEDGKARLAPPILRDGAVPTYRELESSYPLALITPATHRTINSMFGEFNAAEACVRMHPEDALVRAVADGDTVRMWNDLGAIEVVARLDGDLRPGVVSMPKGLWRRDVPGGLTANALVPDTLNDLAGGACFNDARVEIASLRSG